MTLIPFLVERQTSKMDGFWQDDKFHYEGADVMTTSVERMVAVCPACNFTEEHLEVIW
jgi:hypothetical protein